MKNKKIVYIFLLLLTILTIGTIGYMLITGVNFLDALYMTIITISTVGYQEVAELDYLGKVFTIFIILCGLGTVAYGFTNLASFLLEGEFEYIIRRRRMEKRIDNLKNHYILCGAGQTGQSVIERFQKSKTNFIVIEKNREKADELMKNNINTICDDATHEEALEKGKIKYSKGLVSCLATDADNVFTVLTARGLNPKLHIVSRAIEKNAHHKLRKAGANNTLSPNELGGARMAFLLLRPNVVSFLDIITHVDDQVFDLEEVIICKKSSIVGEKLKDARIPEKTGLIVLAIKKKGDEKLHFNPNSEVRLNIGDRMLVMGKIDQINVLRKISCDPTL